MPQPQALPPEAQAPADKPVILAEPVDDYQQCSTDEKGGGDDDDDLVNVAHLDIENDDDDDDLVQIDYPEEEKLAAQLQNEEGDESGGGGADPTLEELIQGLNWYAYFQIAQMQRRKRRDGHSAVFIDKLNSEIRQTQVCIYREFQRNSRRSANEGQEDGAAAEDIFDNFDRLSLPALCQLLGTFMPIAKLRKEGSYLIGTEAKQVTVRGQ